MNTGSKWFKYSRNEAKEWMRRGLSCLALGLLLLVGGIFASVSISSDYREYSSSGDIRTVTAHVTRVSYTADKPDTDKNEEAWSVHFEYEVDGQTYTASDTYHREIRSGDTFSVTVYQTKKGDYKIPYTTGQGQSTIYSITYVLMAAVGAMILGFGVYTLYGSAQIKKAVRRKQEARKNGEPLT